MIALQALAVVLGAGLVVATGLSAVKTVILPRAAGSLVTRAVFVMLRRALYVLVGRSSFAVRDRVLAYYAPVALILLPGVWVALVMLGFTGILWGVGVHPWRDAFLVSGSSILTLGTAFRRELPFAVLSFVEATLGLGLVALQISYLPTIYGAFSRREQLVGMLEVRAGLPPSPAVALVRFSRISGLDRLVDELIAPWEPWFSDIEESHTTLPALVFFRSPQPERSWITAAGCVLDTAALLASTVDLPRDARVDVTLRAGFFSLRRIADYFALSYDPTPRPTDAVSVMRAEFDAVCAELEAGGVPLRADRDRAWADFAGWRVNYDAVLTGLAALVDAPLAPWSSDRSPLTRPQPRVLRRWRAGAVRRGRGA